MYKKRLTEPERGVKFIMTDGLVSIIMPSWNTSRFIGESIQSVLVQTYTNWELLIVDDCSTDNTDEILLPRLKKILDLNRTQVFAKDCANLSNGIKVFMGIKRYDSQNIYRKNAKTP